MKSITKLFGLIFGLIGVVMLAIAICVTTVTLKRKNEYRTTSATITDIDTSYSVDDESEHRVRISYRVSGTIYETDLSYYSSGMSVGDTLTIYYNPDNPNKICYVSGMWLVVAIVGVIGVVFGTIGGIFLIVGIRRDRLDKRLIAEGNYVYADIDCVDYNTMVSINGRHPYIIKCRYYDQYSDITYLYKSRDIRFDPTEILSARGITQLKVYVSKDNPKQYMVDISELEKRVVNLS